MGKTRVTILICVLLAVLTLGAFWRVLGCGFVDYDDDVYITANRWVLAGLTGGSIKWALTAAYESTWQPMVWLSYMADYEVYGLNPFGYHLTNLLLHIASVLLLFLILGRMTGSLWKSAFVAALFAVHPLRVESVAWIAERKDVLSGVFWMLSMGAYVLYTERPRWKRYVPVFLFMALGLMAKPTLVTLPFALLLLDYWPLGRFGKVKAFGRLLLEKVPLICLSAGSVAIASMVQMKSGGLEGSETLSAGVRLANTSVSYIAYLVKMVWPAKLAVLYPHPTNTLPAWQVIGSAVVLVCLTVIALRFARRRPWLAVGWLWYLCTMLPMIGIVQTGLHGMADRFTYIPLIGVFMALTWGIAEYGGMGVWGYGRRQSDTPTLPHSHTPTLWIPAILVILACAVGTWRQTGYWKDSVSLFQRAVDVTERNSVMETNLGLAFNKGGEYEKGIAHFQASIDVVPTAKPYSGIGVALTRMNRLEEAVPYYEKSLELDPDSALTRTNLGFVLLDLGRVDRAVTQFNESIRIEPDESAAHFGLAVALYLKGDYDSSWEEVRLAEQYGARIDPEFLKALSEKASEQ